MVRGAEGRAVKVLITGGAGFIGSHLAESYLADGHEVVVLDDFSTGREENLAAVRDHPKLAIVRGSVLDPAAVASAAEGCDRIVHLAAVVGVRLVIEEPIRTFETNLRGTEVVLHEAARANTPLFIASTSEVYGKNEAIPFREDHVSVIGPTTVTRWGYACSKMADEFLALAFHRERGLPVVVGRLFNTVGPRQSGRYGMVIPRFVEAALEGRPLEVYGDGRQTRCFCDVSDVVRFVRALLENPEAYGKVVNIGSEESVAIADLARLVLERTGSSSEIRFVPYDEAFSGGFEDMRHRKPDTTLLRALTGRAPQVRLTAIVDRVIEDIRRRRGGA